MENPAPAADRADRIGTEVPANPDEDRVTAPFAQVLDADPAGQLTAADHLAGIFGKGEKNSPLLCAQMPEGVDGI